MSIRIPHADEWRDPSQLTSQWQEARDIDRRVLRFRTHGEWWESLAKLAITLLITREYEHLVLAVNHDGAQIGMTFQPLPHPSGLVVDRQQNVVYIASTRNPNQIYDFEPVSCQLLRGEPPRTTLEFGRPLVPVRSRFYPGCMYFHDLALIETTLYANAVAHNAVVRLDKQGGYERAWWPRCIETERGPDFSLNYLQLNSIAAAEHISASFFSASTAIRSRQRPGHKNFQVDRQGVIFSGATREPCARGLTRPHSARVYQKRLWVDNSGYGEFGYVEDERFIPIVKLPGWTRGLCFVGDTAFIGTSQILSRFRHYAPGVDAGKSVCGVHALDLCSGKIVGSLIWPNGNQIFALDWLSLNASHGFPFQARGRRTTIREKQLFYAFQTHSVHARSTQNYE